MSGLGFSARRLSRRTQIPSATKKTNRIIDELTVFYIFLDFFLVHSSYKGGREERGKKNMKKKPPEKKNEAQEAGRAGGGFSLITTFRDGQVNGSSRDWMGGGATQVQEIGWADGRKRFKKSNGRVDKRDSRDWVGGWTKEIQETGWAGGQTRFKRPGGRVDKRDSRNRMGGWTNEIQQTGWAGGQTRFKRPDGPAGLFVSLLSQIGRLQIQEIRTGGQAGDRFLLIISKIGSRFKKSGKWAGDFFEIHNHVGFN